MVAWALSLGNVACAYTAPIESAIVIVYSTMCHWLKNMAVKLDNSYCQNRDSDSLEREGGWKGGIVWRT